MKNIGKLFLDTVTFNFLGICVAVNQKLYLEATRVGGIDKYHTTVLKIKVLRYN